MHTPISALSSVQAPPRPMPSTGLTQEQNKKLANTLSNFDAQNLSKDDAKALVIQIKELGITSGRDLHDALAKSGINARDLASKAGIERPAQPAGPPPGKQNTGIGESTGRPPPPEKKVDDTALALLKEAMLDYAESETEESFADILAAKLTENGYDSREPIVDYYA